MNAAPVKRFYERVATRPGADGGHEILLDQRPVRTPGKVALRLPTAALAEAVAGEWEAQEERIRPATMPLMSLACTAIDRIAPRRAEIVAEILGHAETDLLCYRAAHPARLVARQAARWQPLLDWAALALDAPLRVTTGVLPVRQPDTTLAALRHAVEPASDLHMAALASATGAAGSLVIGLALAHGRLSAAEAFEAAELDATFQIEQWGEDPEATRRREAVRADLEAAERLMTLVRR